MKMQVVSRNEHHRQVVDDWTEEGSDTYGTLVPVEVTTITAVGVDGSQITFPSDDYQRGDELVVSVRKA